MLLNACKDIGLAVNTRKTKYMKVECYRGLLASEHITVVSNTNKQVKTSKYLGSLLTIQNSIQEEIKCRLKERNSCYYSVQTLLSSRLLSKNMKIKIYKAIILPVMLYGCKTWEECRLKLFKSRILRRIFGPKRDANGEWRRLKINSFYRSPNSQGD